MSKAEGFAPPWVQSVTLAERDRQKALGWPDWHPEDFCSTCGQRNPRWGADNDAWSAVFGEGVSGPIVCPPCFALMYEDATGERPYWLFQALTKEAYYAHYNGTGDAPPGPWQPSALPACADALLRERAAHQALRTERQCELIRIDGLQDRLARERAAHMALRDGVVAERDYLLGIHAEHINTACRNAAARLTRLLNPATVDTP